MPATERRVVITIDDLPAAIAGSDRAVGSLRELESWNRTILSVLEKHHVPALGIVNGFKVQIPGERDARANLLKAWTDAGMELGNHTYSHVHFSTVSLDQFEDDTVRGEVVVRELLASAGAPMRYFRHPALDRGTNPITQAAPASLPACNEAGRVVSGE